jgi:hypothetical protein
LPTKFNVDISYGLRAMSRTRFKNRTIKLKLGKAEYWFFCIALLFNEIYLHVPIKFHTFLVSKLCPGKLLKCKNEQQAKTSTLGKAVICTEHLPIEIWLPTKLNVNTTC